MFTYIYLYGCPAHIDPRDSPKWPRVTRAIFAIPKISISNKLTQVLMSTAAQTRYVCVCAGMYRVH